jgi:CheY-like chemotaxis protein
MKPRASTHLGSRDIAASAPPQFTGHVLLVEDNDVSALIAKAQLRRLGVSVDHAADGLDALRSLSTKTFDLVLMDCQLPLMDGFETTERLRQVERSEQRQRTPVIAFTAQAYDCNPEAFFAKGMDDYLSKPIVQDALARILSKFLPMSERPTQ